MKNTFQLKPIIAEFVGTFLLTLIVLLSINIGKESLTPVLAALTLGTLVYVFGGISGTQINPAITIGLWAIKKIKSETAISFIVAQVLGALAARVLASSVMLAGREIVLASPWVNTGLKVGAAEAIGTAILAMGVATAVLNKVSEKVAGVVIGTSLFLGIMIASSASNGVLNPAVAIGIGSISHPYFWGPVLGSCFGFMFYRWMVGNKEFGKTK
jgi:glycerol uptake facilitator-like aquaporin